MRGLADRHRVHRRTVRQALANRGPAAAEDAGAGGAAAGSVEAADRRDAAQDLDAPRKQRHTARRVLARLVDEHGVRDMSYSTVRDYVARRRPEIAAEAGRSLEEGFVPQTHPPAAEAEVDFADLWVILRGVKTKTCLFTMRLSFSGGRCTGRRHPRARRRSWRGTWTRSPARRGPAGQDPLRQPQAGGVAGAVRPQTGQETERWMAFRSHYGFDAFYCQPGAEGAHEKGGVEGEGGRFRRTHCVPMPVVDSIDELNELLEAVG